MHPIIKTRFFQDLVRVLSGSFVAQSLNFLVVVMVSRTLGPELYGAYAVIVAIFLMLVQIADLGVTTSYVKYIAENLEKRAEVFASVLAAKLIFGALLSLIMYLIAEYLSLFFFDSREYEVLIKVTFLFLILHSVFMLIIANYQSMEEFRKYSMLNIYHSLIKLLCVVLIILNRSIEGIELFVYAYAAPVSTVIISMAYKFYQRSYPGEQYFPGIATIKRHVENVLRVGVWVLLSSLLVSLMMRMDVMMLQKMKSSYEVGILTVAMSLNSIFLLLLNSANITLLPKVKKYVDEKNIGGYLHDLFKYKYLLLALLLVVMLLSPVLITVLFGERYAESMVVFQWLMLTSYFSFYAGPMSLVYYYLGKSKNLTIMNLVQLIIVFLLNYALIPIYGVLGVIISISFMRLIGFMYIFYTVKRYARQYSSGAHE